MRMFPKPPHLHKMPPLPDHPALLELAAHCRERQNADRAQALAAAYHIGQLIVEAPENPILYGKQMNERLAALLGVTLDEVERICELYHVFDADFMTACQSRKSAMGNRISVGHLYVLAEVRDPQKRHELTEEIYAKDLTVEALRQLIQTDGVIIKVRPWRRFEPEPLTPLECAMELTRVMKKLKTGLRFWKDGIIENVTKDSQNRLFTILLNRLQEAAKLVKPNLASLTEIYDELKAASEYLRDNMQEPQDPDPRDEWHPKPRA
jgi:hypothetical protein